MGSSKEQKGAKTEIVQSIIKKQKSPFTINYIQNQCPGVSIDMIRYILKKLKFNGEIRILGRGKYAQWEKV